MIENSHRKWKIITGGPKDTIKIYPVEDDVTWRRIMDWYNIYVWKDWYGTDAISSLKKYMGKCIDKLQVETKLKRNAETWKSLTESEIKALREHYVKVRLYI